MHYILCPTFSVSDTRKCCRRIEEVWDFMVDTMKCTSHLDLQCIEKLQSLKIARSDFMPFKGHDFCVVPKNGMTKSHAYKTA